MSLIILLIVTVNLLSDEGLRTCEQTKYLRLGLKKERIDFLHRGEEG